MITSAFMVPVKDTIHRVIIMDLDNLNAYKTVTDVLLCLNDISLPNMINEFSKMSILTIFLQVVVCVLSKLQYKLQTNWPLTTFSRHGLSVTTFLTSMGMIKKEFNH